MEAIVEADDRYSSHSRKICSVEGRHIRKNHKEYYVFNLKMYYYSRINWYISLLEKISLCIFTVENLTIDLYGNFFIVDKGSKAHEYKNWFFSIVHSFSKCFVPWKVQVCFCIWVLYNKSILGFEYIYFRIKTSTIKFYFIQFW